MNSRPRRAAKVAERVKRSGSRLARRAIGWCRWRSRNPVHELAVFTDGIEPLVLQYSTNTVHSPWFNQMLPPVRGLAQPGFDEALSKKLAMYLSSEAVCARTDDDKTLLLASRIKTL
jgi:hypothetical protein